MATLSLIKYSNKVWKLLASDVPTGSNGFSYSKLQADSDGLDFFIVSEGGATTNRYQLSNITVFASPSGTAETGWASMQALLLRLEELNFPAWNESGAGTFNLRVQEEGETAIQNVNRIVFDGATVEDNLDGSVTVTISGGGVTEFLQLTDVDETTYTGQGGKVVAVKSDATGLEFITVPSGETPSLAEVLAVGSTATITEEFEITRDGITFGYGYAGGLLEDAPALYQINSNILIFFDVSNGGVSVKDTVSGDKSVLQTNTLDFILDSIVKSISINSLENTGVTQMYIPDDEGEVTIASREWVTANVSGGASLIREEFTFGLSQTFTLANNYGQVYSVEVQGQGALSTSQYTLVSPNQVTINDTLNSGDYVVIIYSNAITGVQPYYSQAETDALVNSVALLKSVGPTYTTNAILTVTQAEYDALTPDPTTLYVIL